MQLLFKRFMPALCLLALLCACAPSSPPAPIYTPPPERQLSAEDYFNSGMNSFESGNYTEAIEDFRSAVRLRPNYVEAHYYMGLAFERAGEPQSAESQYQRCIDIDSKYLPAREALGFLLYDAKRFDEASKHLEVARSLNSVLPEVYYCLGEIYLMKKNCRQAIAAFEHALKLDASYKAANQGLARARKSCRAVKRGSPGPRTEKSFIGGGKAIDPKDF